MLNALRFSVNLRMQFTLFLSERKNETFLDISGIAAAGKKNRFFVYLSIFLSWLLL